MSAQTKQALGIVAFAALIIGIILVANWAGWDR